MSDLLKALERHRYRQVGGEPVYAILRMTKHKSVQSVRAAVRHSLRIQDVPNADPDRREQNIIIGPSDDVRVMGRFDRMLQRVPTVRKNAVLATEFLIAASPGSFESREQWLAYLDDGLRWIQKRHPAETIISAAYHFDETTPHLQVLVAPINEKGRLSHDSFYGGSKYKLSALQTEFAQDVGQAHGLERGVEGSRARHEKVQRFYGIIDKDPAELTEGEAAILAKRDRSIVEHRIRTERQAENTKKVLSEELSKFARARDANELAALQAALKERVIAERTAPQRQPGRPRQRSNDGNEGPSR